VEVAVVPILSLLFGCGAALDARFAEIEAMEPPPAPELDVLAEQPPDVAPPPPFREPTPELPLPPWPVRAIDATHYVVDYGRLRASFSEDLWTVGRALEHTGPDDRVDGVRLSGLRRGGFGEAIGLKNGDIVHTVNGALVEIPGSAPALWALIDGGQRIEASMSRRAEPMTFVWEPGVVAE